MTRNRTPRHTRPAFVAALTALAMPGCAPNDAASPSGAIIPHHVLAEPEVVSGDFGSVTDIRARSNGSLLVADGIGGELVLVDLDAGTRTVVGRRGQGPEEYLVPSGLWPLPGDSTLLVDPGNNRLTVLAPDLSFGETQPMVDGDSEGGIWHLTPEAIDGDGHIYLAGAVTGSDSTAILRIARANLSADTVAWLAPQPSLETWSLGMWTAIMESPYVPSDSWGVAPDGSVVVARASGYRVEWIRPDGFVRGGAPVAYDPVPVGQAEREAWMQRRAAARRPSTSTSTVTVSGSPGSMITGAGAVPTLTISGGDDMDDYDWPETLPAFTGRIRVDPEGCAWIRRRQPVGAPGLYDIFTPDAEHAGTVETAHGHSVAGFGDGVVYLTFRDEVDLVYIARHPLPWS